MSKKFIEWLRCGGRIPRKLKKSYLGEKVRMSALRRMLRETIVGEPVRTMYERVEFTPHGAFCPHCGEKKYLGSGNMAAYPEHWERFECLRCRSIVGYIDNSPFIHALECEEENYIPIF